MRSGVKMEVLNNQGLENEGRRAGSRGIPRNPTSIAARAKPGFRFGFVEPNTPMETPINRTGGWKLAVIPSFEMEVGKLSRR